MTSLFMPCSTNHTSYPVSDCSIDLDYSTTSCQEDENSDEEFSKMSEEEKNDIKYLGIFDTHQDFDEEIMITNDIAALKEIELTMI